MNATQEPVPEISVIIPAYNCVPYLRKAVMSVLSQNGVVLEVIVIDDGSTDGTALLCDSLSREDRRVSVVHQPNSGPSVARNVGIDRACGRYVCFVDGDDELFPGSLAQMKRALEGCDAPLLVAGFIKSTNFEPRREATPLHPRIYPWQEITRNALYQKILVNTAWGALYRRNEMFADGSLRFRPGILYEDLDFFYRAFHKAQKVAFSREQVYFYRVTPGSLTQKWSDGRLDVLQVAERIVEYMRSEAPALLPAARDRQFAACCNMLALALKYRLPSQQFDRIASLTLPQIRAHRLSALFSPHTRRKNRLGALASLLPRDWFFALLRSTSGR